MLRRAHSLSIALLICCVAYQPSARAQSGNHSISNLTIYNAGIAEFLEERTIELQQGYNTVEWRSLMPKANIRTVRVLAEDAEVVRQDVTYDGAQVNNEKSPVLHLVIQNRGATGRKRIQVDYLAPNISWQSDYSLVLDPTPKGEAPTAATLDSWVSLYNNAGVDLAADTVDLVAGEIALLPDNAPGAYRGDYAVQSSANVGYSESEASSGASFAEVSSLSAFNRFTLGQNIKLNANALISRFPIFQRARLAIVQRNVFENTHDTQTLGLRFSCDVRAHIVFVVHAGRIHEAAWTRGLECFRKLANSERTNVIRNRDKPVCFKETDHLILAALIGPEKSLLVSGNVFAASGIRISERRVGQ